MISIARYSIRRPQASLAAWLVIAIALSMIGLGVASSLSPSVTVVPGSQSARAQRLANAQFGPTQLVPILLEGPKQQLDREGPKLVAALARRPQTRVLSAWDAGTASAGLRPEPTAATIVVSVDRSEKDVVRYDEPQIEGLVGRDITAPVRAYVTGQASIDRALKDAAISNLRRSELIAIGILFLLLLIGLRAPVAALLVTATGAVSTLAGFGLVALLGHVITLDPVGVALGTMTGLALGVAFALLILDRFHREELRPGAHPRDAVTAATADLETMGKAVLIGGTALVLALAIAAVIGPTQLMVSLGTGMLVCAAFATGSAVVVMPAALVLLGRRIDAYSFPAPAPLVRAWSSIVDGGNQVARHAVYAGFAATALLAVLAVPAFALKSGPPDVSQLPSNARARIAFEQVSRVMGPGWATPYSLIVVANNRPITTPALLENLYRFQLEIAKEPMVDSVTGPGAINSTSAQLSTFGPQLKHSAAVSDQSKKNLLQLIQGLGQAGAGSSQLQAGLSDASSGASMLQSGSGQAQSGASQLHAGLVQANAGSTQLKSGLDQALAGATALKNGAGQALHGSSQLEQGIGQAHQGASQSVVALNGLESLTTNTDSAISGVQSRVQSASAALGSADSALGSMTTGRNDPHYGAAVASLQSAAAALAGLTTQLNGAVADASQAKALASGVTKQAPALVKGLAQLQGGASQLEAGIKQLRDGNAELATGITQLSTGGGQLTSGLGQLTAGAGALQIGLGQLTYGAGQLASGLTNGVGPAGQLVTGLGTMQAAVIKARGQIPSTKQLEQLEQQSPGIFNSGYFVLAAVEGAQPSDRNAATFTINLLRGGTAGQIVVVSKYKSNDSRTGALGTHLVAVASRFARVNNVQVAVGGPEGSLGDLTRVTKSRIWLDVIVIAVALTLVLALALRAVLLPAVATLFGLLVAAASFGVLEALFGGSSPVLGGPGYLDPMSIIGIFTVTFGITTTFSAVLLMRTREEFVAGAATPSAVRIALRETGAAATGAGLVMVASLIPFLATSFVNVQQFGIGVAVAVLLDVLLVRPVLLPSAETLLGRFGWWPTSGPSPDGPTPASDLPGRASRLPVRHRRPGAVHE
ncbi:MAG TPA: MMPL family transporter [Solirubrobacteraceae bacterium]|nr:MMPL family transporter [Solirubrobacteraceae bacterium]